LILLTVIIAGLILAWVWRKREEQNPIHFGRSTDEDQREPLRSCMDFTASKNERLVRGGATSKWGQWSAIM